MAQLILSVELSGHYLFDTIYFYTRDSLQLKKTLTTGFPSGNNFSDSNIHTTIYNDTLSIDALYYVLRSAESINLLGKKPGSVDISKISIYQNFHGNDFKKVKYITEHMFSSIESINELLSSKEQEQSFKDLINSLSLSNISNKSDLNYEITNEIIKQNIYLNPSTIHQRFIANHLPINEVTQNTFDYVILLFSIGLAKNYNFDWENSESETTDESEIKYKTNLQRRNGIITMFLSIFIAYINPIMDNIYEKLHTDEDNTELTEYYNIIIFYINNIILYYNSCTELNDDLEPNYNTSSTSNPTTYQLNKKYCKQKSNDKNKKDKLEPFEQEKYYDLSYDMLDSYNSWLDSAEQENNIDYRYIYQHQTTRSDRIKAEYLTDNPNINRKLLIPSIPTGDNPNQAPILSMKHGLAQPEMQKIFDNIDFSMCKSNLGFASTSEQFTTTGIIEKHLEKHIYKSLSYPHPTVPEIDVDVSSPHFDINIFFDKILTSYKDIIGKFKILTAINSHFDFIKFVSVGGFDCHIKTKTIQSLVANCQQNFAVITCITPTSNNIFKKPIDIQGVHRSMLIFDLRMTEHTHKKIYYFEPFGQYYLVYDMFGRVIPHIYEMVIARRLNKVFSEIGQRHENYNIVIPFYIPNQTNYLQLCNTGIFKFNRFGYLGINKPKYSYFGNIINSTQLVNDKVLDWYTGYCGLIVVFMMLLIKINCNMPELQNTNSVDDILMWFGHFNKNPFYTYDNVLAQSLIRGFANLIEKLLANKVYYIEPVIYDLEAIDNALLPQPVSHNTTKYITKDYEPIQNELNFDLRLKSMYNQLGLRPENIFNQTPEMQKKMNTIIYFIYNTITGKMPETQINTPNGKQQFDIDKELNTRLDQKYIEYFDKQRQEPTFIQKIFRINSKGKPLLKYGVGKVLKNWIIEKMTKRRQIHIIPDKTKAIFQKIIFVDLLNDNPDN